MSQQRSPNIGLEIWEAERAAAGVYDPSIPPDERPTQGCRRIARKSGRSAIAEAIREWAADRPIRDCCACPHGGGHNGFSALACSWETWITGQPSTHPKRLRHEAGDPSLDWEDLNYNGDPCRCICHADEDL